MKRASVGLWFVLVFTVLPARTAAGQAAPGPAPPPASSAVSAPLPDPPAPDVPEVNPGRPTIANPATLTPVGYLQFETGILGAADSPEFSSRTGMNEVVKLAVAPRLMLIAGGEPYVHFEDPFGQRGSAWGDISVGAQAVLKHGEGTNPTLAVNYLYHAHDAGGVDLDLGSADHSLVLLASADVKGFHYDFNVLINQITRGSVRRGQFGQTISIAHPLKGNFSIGGELWHFTQPFLRGNAFGSLWNLGYTARKNLVFDIGFDRGLTGTSTRWEGFAGFTYLLPHRWW
jgi:hypothetical protein